METRPSVLENAPLHYAPENELGVVFLFSAYCKKYKIRIEKIQAGFPDCVAFQKAGDGEKKIRIEFEYKSKNFKSHRHSAKNCDWIVCWEHNWPDVPKHLRVIELKREFGLGFNVWIQPVGGEFKKSISNLSLSDAWTVPSQAHKGDLVLFYHNAPDQCVKEVFRIISPVKYQTAGWKSGMDYMASIKLVCRLQAPLFLSDLKYHKIISTASFVRANVVTGFNISEYWVYLAELLIRRNRSLHKLLEKYLK
jgi:hypothetical protein